jgi:hypothetical protein
LFVDRSVGKYHVPEALRLAGVKVRIHDDHFDPTTPDEGLRMQVNADGLS